MGTAQIQSYILSGYNKRNTECLTVKICDKMYYFFNKNYLSNNIHDWLRAVQFLGNTVPKKDIQAFHQIPKPIEKMGVVGF